MRKSSMSSGLPWERPISPAYNHQDRQLRRGCFFPVLYLWRGELAFTKQAYAFGLYDKMHAIQPCAGDVETWHGVKKGEPYPKGALATGRFPFWAIDDPKSNPSWKNTTKKFLLPLLWSHEPICDHVTH